MIPRLVVIKGAGDLATGVAHRLRQSGFELVMLELAQPLAVRRTVSFATAVFLKTVTVEGIRAELCPTAEDVPGCLARKNVPLLVDPEAASLEILKPKILIDAIMAKENRVTKIKDAELVIGLGPGFSAGVDVDAVVETNRGHALGRVIYEGSAASDTGEPGLIAGYGKERLLRAPVDGLFKPVKEIGELVARGEIVATVEGSPIKAEINGLIRGLLYPDLLIKAGTKVGDIDPRGAEVDFRAISDKARAIGGAVLEAILNRYYRMEE